MFERMLNEDKQVSDITSELIIPQHLQVTAKVVAKEDCIAAGLTYLSQELKKHRLEMKILVDDGEPVKKSDVVALITGNARTILLCERVFLNILGRMDFLINFDNNTTRNSPSKLIDYAIVNRPVLNIKKEIDKDEFLSCLEGDYSKTMDLPDPNQYHIKVVTQQFLDLSLE